MKVISLTVTFLVYRYFIIVKISKLTRTRKRSRKHEGGGCGEPFCPTKAETTMNVKVVLLDVEQRTPTNRGHTKPPKLKQLQG